MSNKAITVPSNPTDREKLFKLVKELSNSMTRASSEGEYQKEAIKEASDEFGIEGKWIKKMVVDYHKDQFDKKAGEFEDYSSLYETIIKE